MRRIARNRRVGGVKRNPPSACCGGLSAFGGLHPPYCQERGKTVAEECPAKPEIRYELLRIADSFTPCHTGETCPAPRYGSRYPGNPVQATLLDSGSRAGMTVSREAPEFEVCSRRWQRTIITGYGPSPCPGQVLVPDKSGRPRCIIG